MRRVLFLCKRLSRDRKSAWLTDELVAAFREDGWSTEVVLLDLSGSWRKGTQSIDGTVIHVFPVARGGICRRASAFLISYVSMMLLAVRIACKGRYDLIINFSVASVFFGFVSILKLFGSCKESLVFVWDFFPFHQYQIGRINNKFLMRIFAFAEKVTIFSCSHVAVMSVKNKEYFRQLYPLYKGEVHVIPIWGKYDKSIQVDPDLTNALGRFELNIVFGGQITAGRGISNIVQLCRLLSQNHHSIGVHVFGDGDLLPLLEQEVNDGLKNLIVWGKVNREVYRRSLVCADVGLIVTVTGVDVPTFPSKVVDYFMCKKPVLACVEGSTDFGEFVQDRVGAGLSCIAGNDGEFELYQNALELLRGKQEGWLADMGDKGFQFFLEEMEVSVVMRKIVEKVGGSCVNGL